MISMLTMFKGVGEGALRVLQDLHYRLRHREGGDAQPQDILIYTPLYLRDCPLSCRSVRQSPWKSSPRYRGRAGGSRF